MDVSAVQGRLAQLFDAADAERGAVVVWYDAPGDFADDVAQLELPGVEVLVEEPGRLFELKRRLNEPLGGRRVLVYRRRPRGELANNWLADVECFAASFQADGASLLMADLGADDVPGMAQTVAEAKGFLRSKRNCRRVAALRPGGFKEPRELQVALMAAALGEGTAAEALKVVRAYLVLSHTEPDGAPEGRLRAAGVWDAFCTMVQARTGFQDDPANAAALTRHVLLTALAATLPVERLQGLEGFVSYRHREAWANEFRAWQQKKGEDEVLYELCREVERACDLPARLDACPTDELAPCEVFPCVNEVLLRRFLGRAAQGGRGFAAEADRTVELANARKNLPWYRRVSTYFDALVALARMARFAHEHPAFPRTSAKALWDGYREDWWRMDACYRHFHAALAAASREPAPGLDDALKEAAPAAERLYVGAYLEPLGEAWDALTQDDRARLGYVDGVARQELFYMNEVAPRAKERGRTYVVVSDALRYDVARELANGLEAATQGQVEVDAVQAMFPSVTPCGMAALLPHGAYALSVDDGRLSCTCDGLPTAGRADRERVLRTRNDGDVAVRYQDFIALTREGRKRLVEPARVVYLYHDRIDATGEAGPTEHDVARACDEAVGELTGLVKTLVRELGAANVLVTADHGFLYTHDALPEAAKVGAGEVEGAALVRNHRYVLAAQGSQGGALMEVNMRRNGAPNLVGFSPRGAVRVAVPGGGANYVHGGTSLQETCVPVLRFRNLRANSRDYVETKPAAIELVSQNARITNNLFSFEFFQTEPVGGKVVATTWRVYVADAAGNPVSSESKVVADVQSAERAERLTRLSFSLTAGANPSADREYYLTVENQTTHVRAWQYQVCIDIAFGIDEDFGW